MGRRWFGTAGVAALTGAALGWSGAQAAEQEDYCPPEWAYYV